MRGPKRRRREETSTTGRAKQARSTQPTRSNGGGRNAPKRAAQRPPDKPPAVERPGEPPEGAGRGGPGDPFPRAWSFATRAQPHTATHPRSRGKGGRSRRVSGRAPCHGKAGVLFEPGGWPEACGRGRPAQAKTRRQRRGWGPAACQGRRRDAWAAHRRSPHDRRNLVAAARGQAGRERAPAIARRGPPSGAPQVHTRPGFAHRGEAPSLS